MRSKIFWCKVNKYYLNQWLNYFSQNQKDTKENDLIIATCVVTDRAKTKFIKEIRDSYDWANKIYLTWCAVINKWDTKTMDDFLQIYPELTEYKDKIELLAETPKSDDTWPKFEENFLYTKKFLVIQSGCDSYCTFCLTVHKRWFHETVEEQRILDEINDFQEKWGQEIVLTWVNLCAWGASNTNEPKKTKFNKLLKSILQNTKIPRIRISSLGPEFLDDEFFEIVSDKRFLPHFHFSIQSFSDKILDSMKRHYDSKQLDYVLKSIRNLNRDDKHLVSIGADIITSFPDESDSDFQETLDWIKKYNITKLHAFPFSPHEKWEQIPAGLFPNQIDNRTKKLRQKEIIAVWNLVRENFVKESLWLKHDVLIEEKKWDKWYWWTGNYIQVWLQWDFKRGDVVSVELSEENIDKNC